jgi:hypothetical protein
MHGARMVDGEVLSKKQSMSIPVQPAPRGVVNMPGTQAGSPARIALAILVVVALLTAAVGVTIWRYDHALAASDAAQESAEEVALSQASATTFWHQREAMNEYFLLPGAEV